MKKSLNIKGSMDTLQVLKMKANLVLLMSILLFSLLIMQGFSSLAWSVEKTTVSDISNTKGISSESIYSTSNEIQSISVYGNTIAWDERFSRGGGNSDADIIVYQSGTTHHYGLAGWEDREPAVGSMVIWSQSPVGAGDAKIVSPTGVVYSKPGTSGLYPAIDGSNVAFDAMNSSTGDMVGYIIRGRVGYITPNTTFSMVDISENYIIYGEEVYCITNGTHWRLMTYATLYKVSGDWALYIGRSNFGKSIYMGILNIKTGENDVIVSYNTGNYGGFDSYDFDGSFVVWSYEGTGYIYNIYSKETQNLPGRSIVHVAIGGGAIAWVSSSGTEYSIWMASTPKVGSFVDVSLYDPDANKPDTEPLQLLIIDAQGHRFGGWNPATSDIYREIPGAVVVRGGVTTEYRIPAVNPDVLRYQVIGRHSGKYSLQVHGFVPVRSFQWAWVNATDISIDKDAVHTYTVDWQKVLSGSSSAVKIEIDTNGDGKADKTISAGSSIDESTIESGGSGGLEVSLSSSGCLIVGVMVIVLLVAVIVVVVRRKNNLS